MNNFEQHIKDQMQNFAPTPPPAAWAGVSSGMGTSTAAKVGGKLLLKWVAGVLITGGVVTTAVIYNNQSNSVQSNPIEQTKQQGTNNKDKKVEANTNNASSVNPAQTNSENNNKLGKQNEVLQDDMQEEDITPIPMEITKGNEISNPGVISNSLNNALAPLPKKYNTTTLSAPAKINLSDNTLCPEQVLTANLQNCQGCAINWGDGESEAVNSSEAKHSYKKEGKYVISVKGVSELVTVKKPMFSFEAALINSRTVIYKINNPDNIDLKINFSDGASEITNKKEIKHTISEGELKAEFSTNTYCKVVNETLIKSDAIQPLIPDAFTPNNDGNNDGYEIDFKNAPLKFYQLIISDSKGQVVFTSNKQNAAWDGTYNGALMPAGIYTIQLNYQHEQFEQAEQPVKKQIFLFRK